MPSGCFEPPRKPDAGFIPCTPSPAPDAGTPCAEDETCQYISATSYGCVPAGDAGDYAPCEEKRCAPGFFCATPPNAEHPYCLGLCRKDSDCPQDKGMELCALALVEGGPPALCQRFTPCDPLASPNSCSWSADKCSLWRLPGPFVCMAPGSGIDYAPCDSESDCAKYHACVQYGSSPSVCVHVCSTDDDCPPDQLELCLRRNYPERPPIFCERVHACSPDLQNCGTDDQSCYPYLTSGKEARVASVMGICRTTGTKTLGEPCNYLSDCARGFACLKVSTEVSLCRTICAVDGGTCPSGLCNPINSHFGACY
ncbi:MAG: hypothetical protein QM765_03285 [Myxococcales bacterium]